MLFKILKRIGLYYSLKYYPPFYKIRLKILNPSLAKSIRAENKLFDKLLPEGKLNCVFDGGANVGHLTAYFQSKFRKVIAIEPVPGNAEELRGRFKGNENIVIVESIIDCEEGSKTLFISADKDHSVSTVNKAWSDWWQKENKKQLIQYGNSIKVPTVTLPQLIERYGVPDFIKLDIEGNEWRAISLLSQPVSMISFETHLPEFLNDALKIFDHLDTLCSELLVNATINDETLFFHEFLSVTDFKKWFTGFHPRYAQIFCKLNPSI